MRPMSVMNVNASWVDLMSKRIGLTFALAAAGGLLAVSPASARAPGILAAPNNSVPACATPGRLMAFVTDRNRNLAPRFENLALLYSQIGTELGLRWDYAFYQMLVETGFLTYKGDVRERQNNFAGIAATGNGVPGESYRTVEDGVRAHLQHLLVYADVRVDNPVSDRTRKVQSWRVYRGWPRRLGRPVNFRDMARKWAPNSRGYWRTINGVARRFERGRCRQDDPAPVADLRKRQPDTPRSTATVGEKLARAAITRAQSAGTGTRSALGASKSARRPVASSSSTTRSVSVLNSDTRSDPAVDRVRDARRDTVRSATNNAAPKAETPPAERPSQRTASVSPSVGRFASNFIAAPVAPEKEAPKSCRVWQASYGGQRAVIIKSIGGEHVNYTVLDVNADREQREIEAYVAAYAKGGKTVGRFPSQTKALAKAFALCPSAARRQ